MNGERWVRPMPVAVVLLASFWGLFSTPRAKTVHAADGVIELVGGKVYTSPTEPPIANGFVLIRDGKIVAVGEAKPRPHAPGTYAVDGVQGKAGDYPTTPGAKTILCEGMVIVPGFQNSHVHFEPGKWDDPEDQPARELRKHLEDMLTRYGVTTAIDTGSVLQNTLAIRKRVESGEVAGPRILTAGGPLYPPDGIPYYLRNRIPPEIQKLMAQPETTEAAVKVVDYNLDNGAELIKLFTGSWVERGKVKPMPVDVASAAVAEAHRRGKLVFAHPSDIAGLNVALEAHVDVLAHAIERLDGWNGSYIERMKKANMAMIPTLILFGGNSNIQEILDEVVSYQRAGGQILFGTDVGYSSDYSPEQEYALMARAGLTPMQILASLTTAPAERFGEADKRGRVAAGMDADLVVLDADPAQDAANFAKVHYTLRRGRIIYQQAAN